MASFDEAVELTAAKKFDRAIEAWQTLLEACVAEHGEMAPAAAEYYFRYGDALLRSIEESDELFEEDDDIDIAFEVLEVAKVLWKDDPKLERVCLRLGDLHKMSGNADRAVEDYELCLELRNYLPATDRRIADVHWCLAAAWVENPAKAIHHYELCAASLRARVDTLEPSDPEVAELKDILVELKETIEAAPEVDDLQKLREQATTTTSLGFASPTTTATTTINVLDAKRKDPLQAPDPSPAKEATDPPPPKKSKTS